MVLNQVDSVVCWKCTYTHQRISWYLFSTVFWDNLNWTCCCILNDYLRDSLQVNDNSPALLYDEVSGCKKVSIQKVLPNLFQTLILSIPHSAPSWVEFVYSISSVCVCVCLVVEGSGGEGKGWISWLKTF